MQANERRQDMRRKKLQGYGPDRRRKGEEVHLGTDNRKDQRRRRDRRKTIRRSEDLPDESPFPF